MKEEQSSANKNRSLTASFRHAFDGIFTTVKEERNMKIHLVCAGLVLIFGVWLELQVWEWLICVGWVTLVIGAELINTAVEAIVDIASPQWHPLAKLAKDAAAGAVLVLAIGAAVSAAILFLPRLMERLLPVIS